jgi:hypothetical protein
MFIVCMLIIALWCLYQILTQGNHRGLAVILIALVIIFQVFNLSTYGQGDNENYNDINITNGRIK